MEMETFLPLHIGYRKGSGGEGPKIFMLGKKQGGEQMQVVVRGFLPYLYIGLPEESEEKNGAESPISKYVAKVAENEGEIMKCEVVEKKSIYGYAEKRRRFFKIYYSSAEKQGEVKSIVEKEFVKVFGAAPELFETNVGVVIRFMVDKGIVGMGYVSVKKESSRDGNGRDGNGRDGSGGVGSDRNNSSNTSNSSNTNNSSDTSNRSNNSNASDNSNTRNSANRSNNSNSNNARTHKSHSTQNHENGNNGASSPGDPNDKFTNRKDKIERLYVHVDDLEARNEIKKLPPLKILSFDIECIGKEGKFPNAKTDPVVQIGNTIAQYPSQEPIDRVLFCVKETSPIANVTIMSYSTEEEMLAGWSEWVVSADPDILTGYNVCRFDFAYLLERAEVLNVSGFKKFSRTGEDVRIRNTVSVTSAFGTVENKIVTVPGRIVFDVLDIVRREFKLHNYSLNSVSSAFLNEEKEDVHYSEIASLFKGTNETRKRLGTYCMKDSYLPLRIIFTKNLLVNYCELARVTGVPFEYLVTRGQGIRVLSQLLRKAKENSYILPHVVGEDEKYEGAYVMPPEKGFYADPVAVLDFASLYPSVIMAYNLCYTTLLREGEEQGMKIGEDYTRSPSGDLFVTPKIRAGLLPQILASLLDSRKQAKKELARETDAETKMSLDARQLALKISANSVYGFTGAAKTGLPCIPISRSVTAYGREILMDTKKIVEKKYRPTQNHALRVAYGDTDSLMITAPGISLVEAFEMGDKVGKFVTKELPRPLTLAFEKVYHPFLLMSKKRYAGTSKSSPEDRGRLDIKGIEVVRRDNCKLVRDLMKECLQAIFMQNNVEKAKEVVRETVKRLMENRIGIGDLVISKSITKSKEKYEVQQAHTKLAEKMKKRDEGSAPSVGDRVAYVVTRGKGPIYTRSEDPVYVLENDVPIDTAYYLENQLKNPVIRLLEHMVGDVKDLLMPPNGAGAESQPVVLSKKGVGMFLKKKSCCLVCKVGKAPVCEECEGKYLHVIEEARKDLAVLQYKYHLLMAECQRMQHSTHTPILCCNRDCHVFYLRKELTKEIARAQERYDSLKQAN